VRAEKGKMSRPPEYRINHSVSLLHCNLALDSYKLRCK
jgi:hypothetical protein